MDTGVQPNQFKANRLIKAIKRGLDEEMGLTVGPTSQPPEGITLRGIASIYGNLLAPSHAALRRSS